MIERVYSFTLFGRVIQCNLKLTARVDQTILAVVYNQSRTTNKAGTLYLNLQLLLLKVSNDFQSDAVFLQGKRKQEAQLMLTTGSTRL